MSTSLAPAIAQDDAHIFCLPTQIEGEILGVLDLTEKLLSQFGFTDFEVGSQYDAQGCSTHASLERG